MGTRKSEKAAIGCALLAAVLYALSAPLAKLLLGKLPEALTASLLYLGAGLGMALCEGLGKGLKKRGNLRLTRREAPYIVWMILLDVAAPILMMVGLKRTSAANVSLLNNFEIVATAIVALVFFGEAVPRRLWFAIALITLSSFILSFDGADSVTFSTGSAFVLLACVCWGFENNITRVLSVGDPLKIVAVKGIGSGLGSLCIALALGERAGDLRYVGGALALGFVAYGLSIFFYLHAQRALGAAKTSVYYAVAPFAGAALSFAIYRDALEPSFWAALALMIAGAYFASAGPKLRPRGARPPAA